MSSSDGLEFVELVLHARITVNNVEFAATEIEVIWMRKWTAATVLFVVNRISAFLYAVRLIGATVNWSTFSSCKGSIIASSVPVSLVYVTWALFSALRVYAITGGRSWAASLVALAVFVLSIVPFATDLAELVTTSFELVTLDGRFILCETPSVLLILAPFTRGSLVLADLIVLCITWGKTYRIRRDAAAVNMKTELTTLLLRDELCTLGQNSTFLAFLSSNVFLDRSFDG